MEFVAEGQRSYGESVSHRFSVNTSPSVVSAPGTSPDLSVRACLREVPPCQGEGRWPMKSELFCALINRRPENSYSIMKLGAICKRSFLKSTNSTGVALVMVLWVMAILSTLALEFSFSMRTEVNVTRNYKEELQLYAMAQGGVQRAIVELIYKYDSRVQGLRNTLPLEEVPPEKKEWVTDGRVYPLPFEQGLCEVRIISEGGKVNINRVSESRLRKIIGELSLEGEKRDIVVDSILDWRDPDDFYRVNGAENDYYQSLKEPYYCKNGNLDSIEELLLVRGVTRDLFYGKRGTTEEGSKVERIGLRDIFSIYAPGEQVDINSATLPVLRIVLSLPGDVCERILKAREEKAFTNEQDLLQRVPELSPFISEIRTTLAYQSPSYYFTVESRAKAKDGQSVRGLRTIIKTDPRDNKKVKIIQWVDTLVELPEPSEPSS
jgi:general secretion pathway protein K